MPKLARLRVSVVSERGHPKNAHGLAAWLRRVAPARARGAVNIALVSDGYMRALNRTYRGKDDATDVLSFPEGSPPLRIRRKGGKGFSSVSTVSTVVERSLGEIVIALGVMHRQARKAGHHPKFELRILALHGLLHLLGYDHERDEGRMLRVERRLRRAGGLPEGVIERAAS